MEIIIALLVIALIVIGLTASFIAGIGFCVAIARQIWRNITGRNTKK